MAEHVLEEAPGQENAPVQLNGFTPKGPPVERIDVWTEGVVVRVRIPKDAQLKPASQTVDHDYLRSRASYSGGHLELFFCGSDQDLGTVGKIVTARMSVRKKIFGDGSESHYVDFEIDNTATPTHEFRMHCVADQCQNRDDALYALPLGGGLLAVTKLKDAEAVAA